MFFFLTNHQDSEKKDVHPCCHHMLVLMHASALWTAKADSGTKLENEVNTRLGCVLEYYNMCNIYIYIGGAIL